MFKRSRGTSGQRFLTLPRGIEPRNRAFRLALEYYGDDGGSVWQIRARRP